MGYLLHIFLALGIHALGENGRYPALAPLWSGLALFGLPYVLGTSSRVSAMAGRFKLAERLGRAVSLSGPLAFAGLVFCNGWMDSVARWTGSAPRLSHADLSLLLSMAPFLVLQVLAIDAQARSVAAGPTELRRGRSFQLRLLASSLVPVSVYFLFAVLVGLREDVRIHVERVALLNAAFLSLLLTSLAALLPRLLAMTWETTPLPRTSMEGSLLEAVAARASFRARQVLVWRTGHSMANAAIVGLFPSTRIVLFSDSLLTQLAPRELAAVYAHEIGHAARHHVTIFLCWALAFFLGGDLLAQAIAPDELWVASAIVLGAVVVWWFVFSWLSRRFELEADLFSLELLGDPSGLISALERLGGRLRDVAGWRHFSTAERVRFLERAWSEPQFARKHRDRLRWLARLGVLLAVLAVAGQVWSLASRVGEDRVYAELGLGRYEQAAERAERIGLEPELVELSRMGAKLEPGLAQVPASRVEGALRARLGAPLEASSLQEALVYAQLLALRERPELLDLADELEALLQESELPPRQELLELGQRYLGSAAP